MVSIIIPVYNGEHYIAEAIDSLLKQTYDKIEIIVVDDGSEDNTARIVKSFRHVRYIHQENRGVSASRNLGMSIARGDYIAFLDADDLYTPEKVEKQVDVLINSPDVDVVYNDGIEVDKNKKTLNILKSEYVFENRADFVAFLLFRQIVPVPASIMIRKKCINENVFYSSEYVQAEDYDFILRLAERYKFKYIPETLYIYRRHANNLTNAHCFQQKSELEVLRKIGFDKIESIVGQAMFPPFEKRFLLAKIYMKMNEYSFARDIMQQLAGEKPEPYLWFYLGNCSYFLGNPEAAVEYYQKAILADCKMAEAYNNLACIYMGKDKRTASKLLQQALQLRPGYMDAAHNIGQLKSGMADFKLTARELRRSLTNYMNVKLS